MCWWLIPSCQVRIHSDVLAGSARFPERRPDGLIQAGPQPGKTSGKKTQMDKKKTNDTITHLRAKNATYSIHHLGGATRGAGRGKEARPGRRALRLRNERVDGGRRGQRASHKLEGEG